MMDIDKLVRPLLSAEMKNQLSGILPGKITYVSDKDMRLAWSYKQDKKTVDYHLTDGPDHCSVCAHFQKPSGCEKVNGSIAKSGWCKLFRKEV